jgi:hypothetical protein
MASTPIQALAKQVTNGDRLAAHMLHTELEPHLNRILRRAMSTQAAPSGFTQKLRQEANELGSDLSTTSAAARLTTRVVNRLRALPAVPLHARDTLANSFVLG